MASLKNNATVILFDELLDKIPFITSDFRPYNLLDTTVGIDKEEGPVRLRAKIGVINSVENFGLTFGYFSIINDGNSGNAYRLTEKGIQAKLKGGHLKYKRSLRFPPMDRYQIIFLVVFIFFNLISGGCAIYNTYRGWSKSNKVIEKHHRPYRSTDRNQQMPTKPK